LSDHLVAAVDVAAVRPSTIVMLRGLWAEEWFAAESVAQAAEWLAAREPDVIAIDAPCSISKGLLATGADGGKPYAGRVSDLDLMRRGIPLYQVPRDRAAAKSWMEAGYQLYDALEPLGYTLPTAAGIVGSAIEIYPYASFVTLLGSRPLKKTTAEGLAQRADLLEEQGLEWDGRSDHDSLDALAGALTGLRYLEDRATSVGDPAEALIWLPVMGLKASYYSAPAELATTAKPAAPSTRARRTPCACGCGGYPKGARSRFLPGHDAKLASRLRREGRPIP
jgi:predicted nuclease with RNAse H fold